MIDCPDFEVFYTQYKPLVTARVRSLLTRYPQEVEDVVQSAFFKAWRSYERVNPNDNLKGWLYRIASNAALDLLRSKGVHPATSLDRMKEETDWDAPDTSNVQEQVETRLILTRVFHRLPKRSRMALRMQSEGYPLSEIATVMNTTVSAIKATLHRARLEAQAVYQELYSEVCP